MNWKLLGFICEIAVVVAAVAYGLRSRLLIRVLKGRLSILRKGADMEAEKNIAVWDEMRKLRYEIDVSRQGVNRRDKIIQERDRIIADMDEQARELVGELGQLRDVNARVVVLRQELPERRPTDSDAKYLQRCRMAVITKAYEYVQVVDGMALLTVIAPKEDEDVITGATAMDDNCGKRVGGYKGTRIEGPKTAGLNLLEEELSAMKADPRTARELIDLTGDTW
jgi:hypothetical protein